MLETIFLLTAMRDLLTAIRTAVEHTDGVVTTMGGTLSDMKATLLEVETNTASTASNTDTTNTLVSETNSRVEHTNDLIQQYLGDVEGSVSTDSIQDLLNAVISDLHDTVTDLPYLKEITDATDNTFHILESWDEPGRCKVSVSGPVEVEGTVSVEPGLVPLDVVIIP